MAIEGWKSTMPLWQSALAGVLVTAVVVLTCISWVSFFRAHRPFAQRAGKVFAAGLVILTLHLAMGAVLFFIPAWMIPQHDRIGVGWFLVSPVVMLLVLLCGGIAWRTSGKTLVIAAVAGLSLWALVVSNVVI